MRRKEKKKVPGMFDPEHRKENAKSEMTKKKKKKSFAVVQVTAVYCRGKQEKRDQRRTIG